MGELVGLLVVHREENLTTLHGRRDPYGCGDAAASGCDGDLVVGADAQVVSILRVDLGVDRCGVEFT